MRQNDFVHRKFFAQLGFSFIEISVVLLIVGLLVGAGLMLFGKVISSSQSKTTLDVMKMAKQSLLYYAQIRGQLPAPKTVLNLTNEGVNYDLLGTSPLDTWGRAIKMKVSGNVLASTSQYDRCRRLKNPQGYTGWTPASGWIPLDDVTSGLSYSADGSGGKAIAALLVSSGTLDADNNGSMFDGGNDTGTPSYRRDVPTENVFDDIVVAITAEDMWGAVREKYCTAVVTVSDARASGDAYYVYNQSQGRNIALANWQESVTVSVPFDESLVIRDSATGTELKAATKITTNPVTITFP